MLWCLIWHRIVLFWQLHLFRMKLLLFLAFLALGILSVSAIGKSVPECPDGWSKKLSRCYMFSNTTADWFSAWQTCAQHHAGLVSIESKTEMDNVNSWIRSYGKGVSGWWTSGANYHDAGDWVWYGTKAPILYPNFCSTADLGKGHCLALSNGCGLAWVSEICHSTKLRFICEKDPNWI